jgi:hypothetical protein
MMAFLGEEFGIAVHENELNFHADSKQDHGHVEDCENPLASVLGLKLGLNLCDLNE